MNNQVIRERYNEITRTLKHELPEIPTLAITTGTRFWGRIRKMKSNGMVVDIRINQKAFKWLWQREQKGQLAENEMNFEEQLIDTICHELAHITHWAHDHNHAELTAQYVKLFHHFRSTPQPSEMVTAASTTMIKLADIVSDTKKARKLLRAAGIQKPGTTWEWQGQVPTKVKNILGL